MKESMPGFSMAEALLASTYLLSVCSMYVP